jgi:hypothetical protein
MKAHKISAGLIAAAAAIMASSFASAHHSFAMFDNTKVVVIDGTVSKFDYTSPHSWVWVVAKDGKTWGFETEGPAALTRWGIRKSTLKIGDKVSVTGHPTRDGNPTGSFMSVKAADGLLYALGQPPHQDAAKPQG